jgi:hypothetical protein
MKAWYRQLSSQHRYDDEMVGKIRSDWCAYMSAVEDKNLSSFLSYEGDQSRRFQYSQEADYAADLAAAIEDAFATAVGGDAIKELMHARTEVNVQKNGTPIVSG